MAYQELYQHLVDRILKGNGQSAPQQRQAAFNHADLQEPLATLIDKVAYRAHQITDNDIVAVEQNGLSENQLFELIICGAVGQASRQYQSGLTALAEAIKEGDSHAS